MTYTNENINEIQLSIPDMVRRNLQIDCKNCFGFCCVALYFLSSDGFPVDKEAGKPCINLQPDFRCSVHKELGKLGLKGCTTYDCFGAGQKVAQLTFGGHDWREVPETAKLMFDAFLVVRQLHEMLWYLAEALELQTDSFIQGQIEMKIREIEQLTRLSAKSLIGLDVNLNRTSVNILLRQTMEQVQSRYSSPRNSVKNKKILGHSLDYIGNDLRKTNLIGQNLSGAYLIAADLRGNNLAGVSLIGADMRDAELRGTDLRKSIFLTQAQVNAAKGDHTTKLPKSLIYPAHWSNAND